MNLLKTIATHTITYPNNPQEKPCASPKRSVQPSMSVETKLFFNMFNAETILLQTKLHSCVKNNSLPEVLRAVFHWEARRLGKIVPVSCVELDFT